MQSVFIVILALMLYGRTIRYDYVLDDKIVMAQNSFVQQGFAGIPAIFSTHAFAGSAVARAANEQLSGGRYRPLSMAMFAVEYQLGGGSPALSHAINVLLYALLGAVLLFVLHGICADVAALHRRHPLGFLWGVVPVAVAVLFVLHPTHVEVVANIKSRDELLCLLCSLLALRSYLLALKTSGQEAPSFQQQRKNLFASGMWMLCALFSKETAITFLAVLPLTGWFLCGRFQTHAATRSTANAENNTENNAEVSGDTATVRKTLKLWLSLFVALVPAVLAAAVFLTVRTAVLGVGVGSEAQELFGNPFLRASSSERIATAVAVLGRYALYTLHPLTLSYDYSYNEIPIVGWMHWQTLISLAVHLALVAFALMGLRTRNVLAYCVLAYMATISIVSNLFVNLGSLFNERFLFMPGLFALLGWVLVLLALVSHGRLVFWSNEYESRSPDEDTQRHSRTLSPWLVYGVLGLLCVVFAGRTVARTPAWTNEDTLVASDVRNTPNALRNVRMYAGMLMREARLVPDAALRLQYAREAEEQLKRILTIDSTYDDKVYFYLGQIQAMLYNNNPMAVYYYRRALEMKPDDPVNKTFYAFNYGNSFLLRKEYDSALAWYRSAMPNGVEMATLYYNQGMALAGKEEYLEAIKSFQKALEYKPGDVAAQQQIERNTVLYYKTQNKSITRVGGLTIFQELGSAADSTKGSSKTSPPKPSGKVIIE